MFIKNLTYKDYLGNERTEDFYFNLTEQEVMAMEATEQGGFAKRIQKAINSQDIPEVVGIFEKLIMDAYGELSPDGKKFVKSKEAKDNLLYSPAYSIIFMELATDSAKAAEFVNAITPKPAEQEVPNSSVPAPALYGNR